jgi:SAM-dependent methyltransferase
VKDPKALGAQVDPAGVIRGELVDLGDFGSPALAGILTPRAELGAVKTGITDQFLEDAKAYHERYFAASYFKVHIENAIRGRLASDPSVILDIGSGSGNSVLPCLELFPGARIVATDLSENLLAILRDHVKADPASAERLTLVAVDVTKPYFDAGKVDLAVGAAILHHLIDPAACIRQACGALRPGGMAVFFEPFEGGNALLRLAYEQILLMDRQAEHLGIEHVPAAPANWFHGIADDLRRRAGTDKSDPWFQQIDDKWLFTRSYFEDVARSLDGISVEIEPLNSSDRLYSMQTWVNLRLVFGVSDEEVTQLLPGWAWDVLRRYDEELSPELRRDIPVEARVIFSRRER